jgi:hypothetical protein
MATRLQQPAAAPAGRWRGGGHPQCRASLTALENAFSHNRYRHGARFVLRSARLAQTQVLTLSCRKVQHARTPAAASRLVHPRQPARRVRRCRPLCQRTACGGLAPLLLPAAPCVVILEDEPLIAQGLEREVRARFGAGSPG